MMQKKKTIPLNLDNMPRTIFQKEDDKKLFGKPKISLKMYVSSIGIIILLQNTE